MMMQPASSRLTNCLSQLSWGGASVVGSINIAVNLGALRGPHRQLDRGVWQLQAYSRIGTSILHQREACQPSGGDGRRPRRGSDCLYY